MQYNIFILPYSTVAFQVFDTNGDGHLSYEELFGMYRTLTGPVMSDEQILGIVAGVLNKTDLRKPGQLSFDEFCKVVTEFPTENSNLSVSKSYLHSLPSKSQSIPIQYKAFIHSTLVHSVPWRGVIGCSISPLGVMTKMWTPSFE